MKILRTLIVAAIFAALAIPAAAATCPGYDGHKNPVGDLVTALKKAKSTKKKLLFIAGENSCPFCQEFCRVTQDKHVRSVIDSGYVEFKASIDDVKKLADFMKKVQVDLANSRIPVLLVFGPEGTLITAQSSVAFETNSSHDNPQYNDDMIRDWLAVWPQMK